MESGIVVLGISVLNSFKEEGMKMKELGPMSQEKDSTEIPCEEQTQSSIYSLLMYLPCCLTLVFSLKKEVGMQVGLQLLISSLLLV